jgi:hypothetical protein
LSSPDSILWGARRCAIPEEERDACSGGAGAVGGGRAFARSCGRGARDGVENGAHLDRGVDRDRRAAHVRDSDGHFCQTKFTLTPKGSSTLLERVEQYSDQLDVRVDRDTAASSSQSVETQLQAIKQLVETGSMK